MPEVRNVAQYDLGGVGDVPFTFTDAAPMPDGRIAFLACAEASPDTYQDGEVLGCRFGIADETGVLISPIRHFDGRPVTRKLEGLEPRPGEELSFDVVADMDRPGEPALFGRLEVLRGSATGG